MLVRKRQWFSKAEKVAGTLDGSIDSVGAGDGILVLDPSFSPDKPEIEIDTGGASLSREISLLGLETANIGYRLLLRGGSAAVASPFTPSLTTAPEWGKAAQSAGMSETALAYATLDTSNTAGTYLHGETITFQGSGVTATAVRDTLGATGAKLFYENASGTPLVTDNVVGDLSETDFEVSAVETAGGFAYRPDSIVAALVTHGGWTGGTPAAGDIVQKTGDPNVWGVVVSATTTTLVYEPEIGALANSDGVTVTGSVSATATLSSEPALSRGISFTEEYRVDGMLMRALGCRGNVTFSATAGEPAFVAYEAQGIQSSITGNTLGTPITHTENVSQFRNGRYRIRTKEDAESTRLNLPFKVANFSLATNNSLAADLDPENTQGAASFRITDRNPTLTVDPRMVSPSIYDFFGKWAGRNGVYHYIEMPGAEGTRITLEAQVAQMSTIGLSDRDGQVVADINANLRQVSTSGDDEFAIFVT